MTTDEATAIELAEAYFRTRHYERAEEVLRTALAANPEQPGLLTLFANVRLQQDDYATAEASVLAALKVAPHNEYALRVYSRVLEESDRLDEAVDVARRAAERYPLSTYSLGNYARLLDAAGREKDALPVVEDALQLAPHDPELLTLRGDILIMHLEIAKAEADYRAALSVDPEHVDALAGIGKLRLVMFRRWSAIDQFLGVARIDPADSGQALDAIGQVLKRVLRRATWFALIVALAVIVAFVKEANGDSTVWPRVIAGVWSGFLLITYSRLMHQKLPRTVLKAAVRQRKLLGVRIVLFYAALVFGITTAIFGAGILNTALCVLLIPVLVVVTIVGRFRDQ